MHYIAYDRQDQKARKLKKRNVRCYVLPSFSHLSQVLSGLNFKPGLTNWAGQNQFNPGKMPTLSI